MIVLTMVHICEITCALNNRRGSWRVKLLYAFITNRRSLESEINKRPLQWRRSLESKINLHSCQQRCNVDFYKPLSEQTTMKKSDLR